MEADGPTVQGQTHIKNRQLKLCHTSCDLLDAGLLRDYLLEIVLWLQSNPNEVLTILLTNKEFSPGDIFIDPITASGLLPFLYDPGNRNPINATSWPTLETFITSGKRVLLFIDYLNPTDTTPTYLMDEFTYIFETPFSPSDPSFPCTADRPPNAPREQYQGMLILANHNLNTPISFLGKQILVPALPHIEKTNAAEGPSSVG